MKGKDHQAQNVPTHLPQAAFLWLACRYITFVSLSHSKCFWEGSKEGKECLSHCHAALVEQPCVSADARQGPFWKRGLAWHTLSQGCCMTVVMSLLPRTPPPPVGWHSLLEWISWELCNVSFPCSLSYRILVLLCVARGHNGLCWHCPSPSPPGSTRGWPQDPALWPRDSPAALF